MKQRVITGVFIVLVVAVVLWFSYIPLVISAFVALMSAIAVYEIYNVSGMLKKRAPNVVLFVVSELFAIGFPFLRISFYYAIICVVFAVAVVISVINMRFFGKYDIKKLIDVFAIALSFPIMYSALVYVRELENGLIYLLLIVISCFVTDSAAYFVGRAIGKHKLSPVISPKKTVEGFVGGIVITSLIFVLVGLVLRWAFDIHINLIVLFLLGLCCAPLDQFGDLSLSALKRNFGVKDFGYIMPGHGGVLDRFDSMLFVAPFLYIFVVLINTINM